MERYEQHITYFGDYKVRMQVLICVIDYGARREMFSADDRNYMGHVKWIYA
jgi:hypothetical protein